MKKLLAAGIAALALTTASFAEPVKIGMITTLSGGGVADAPPLNPEPFTGLTGTDIVLRSLAIDPAEVHFVDVGSATFSAAVQDIAARTNGGIYRTSPSQAATQIAAAIDTSLRRPYAWAAGPYVGTVGTTFTFDGRGSYGIASEIVSYEWDVDSDGAYEYSGASPTATHTYAAPFDGLVTLRVTDAAGPQRALDRGRPHLRRRRRARRGRGQLPGRDQPRSGGLRRRRDRRRLRPDHGLPDRGQAGHLRQRRRRRSGRRLDAGERDEVPEAALQLRLDGSSRQTTAPTTSGSSIPAARSRCSWSR